MVVLSSRPEAVSGGSATIAGTFTSIRTNETYGERPTGSGGITATAEAVWELEIEQVDAGRDRTDRVGMRGEPVEGFTQVFVVGKAGAGRHPSDRVAAGEHRGGAGDHHLAD